MFRTVSYYMLLLAYTEYTAWRLILDFSCHLSPFMHVTYVCRMYWWFSKACCGDLLLWGTSGSVCEWSVGICVSWFLVNNWCSCGLQTVWILNLWYICCALIHAICVASFSSLPPFVFFSLQCSFTSMYYTKHKPKSKECGSPVNEATFLCTWNFFHSSWTYLVVFTGVFIVKSYNSHFNRGCVLHWCPLWPGTTPYSPWRCGLHWIRIQTGGLPLWQ